MNKYNPIKYVVGAYRAYQAYSFLNAYMKSNPIGGMMTRPPGAFKAQPIPFEVGDNLKALGVDPYTFVAVNTIGKSMSEPPPIVEQKKRISGEYIWKAVDDEHAAAKLFRRPNPEEPFKGLIWRVAMSLCTGNGYLLFDKFANEMYHGHSPFMRVIRDERTGEILHYLFNNKRGDTRELDPLSVVHIKMPNPLQDGDNYGFSPITPVRETILVNYYYKKFVSDFFKHGAVPGGLLSTEQPIGEKQKEPTRDEWNKWHQGANNAHKVAILGSGFKYNVITPPLKDLVLNVLEQSNREQIMAMWNMPPVLAGILKDASFANAYQQIKIFYNTGIFPVLDLIESSLNLTVLPQYGDNLRVRFDRDKILAIQEDKNEQADRSTKLWSGGIAKLNEARKMVGLEPDELYGDLYRIELVADLFTQSDASGSSGNNGNNNGNGDDGKGANLFYMTHKGDKKLSLWDRRVKSYIDNWHDKLSGYQSRIQKKWSTYFDDQYERVRENLDNLSGKGKTMSRLWIRCKVRKSGDYAPDDITKLFDISDETEKAIQALSHVIEMTIQSGATDAIEAFDLSISFNLSDPSVTEVVKVFKNKIVNINETTYDQIRATLRTAYNEGWGYEELASALDEKYADFSRTRSRLIARTETTGMINGGANASYKQAGIKYKKWLATIDGLTREEHGLANGQAAEMNGYFEVGGEFLLFPGDRGNGSAWNVCNCRCALVPSETKDDGFEDEFSTQYITSSQNRVIDSNRMKKILSIEEKIYVEAINEN